MSDTSAPAPDDQPFEPEGKPLASRSGSQAFPDGEWFNLQLDYVNDKGQTVTSYAYFVGTNATWSFWDYISATASNGPKAKFKKDSSDGDFAVLKLQDDNYLSCRANPRRWVYRSLAYPLGWQIVDGKLYTNYHDGPVGTVHQRVAVPDAFYLKVDGGDTLTNCKWVKADN
ncbi:hypothetical protein DYL59_13140 [Pseudomonas kairouanensis]|uniref:Uncharacterized protein n=1 Tax=Pseudomonas kairouanensis TaxID=2293832 RepID=A0A4Z0ASL3_9PSED|nr:hypothetical protein [Pseudomonas kairouanensis]TFY89114.1 hypothetical protein DYL59_13140 [Pseudomonas kairouanensis]